MASAKRGDKKGPAKFRSMCPTCAAAGKESERHVVKYAGYGVLKGFYWTCDAKPEHVERSK